MVARGQAFGIGKGSSADMEHRKIHWFAFRGHCIFRMASSKLQDEICTSQEAHRLGGGGRKMQVPPQLAESIILGVEGGAMLQFGETSSPPYCPKYTLLNLLFSTLLQEEKDSFLTLLLC